jgi:5-methylcytosine-specific restriction enzyme subunit McrC
MKSTNPPPLITLREYERLDYARLGDSGARQLEQVTEHLGIPLFRFFREEARAQQYVGVVRAGDHTIQILPKISERNNQNLAYLIFLLSYAQRLNLRPAGKATFEELDGSFLEVWTRYFATELNQLLRARLTHRYVEVEERISFLRGKLLVERELAGTGRLYGRYACRYDIFTPDHPLNRVLKFCNGLLVRQTRVPSNRTLLQENDTLLSDVTHGPIRLSDLDRIQLDRLDRDYEPVLELCRLLLESSTLNLRAGRIAQFAFVFDMNRLFEEFVAEFLRRHKSRIRLGDGRRLVKVGYQRRLGRLFGEFNMDADLVLIDDAGRSFVVDTKYKVLDPKKRHGGLSQADFYQMYAYGNAGKQRFDDIVLLYPMSDVAERTFQQDEIRLHVRQFDPRNIYDAEGGGPDQGKVVDELSRALSV